MAATHVLGFDSRELLLPFISRISVHYSGLFKHLPLSLPLRLFPSSFTFDNTDCRYLPLFLLEELHLSSRTTTLISRAITDFPALNVLLGEMNER